MSDPFVAEVRIFPFGVVPRGWAACDGQLLPISQNTALFSLLGTTYGGDGKSTFALPNLQGRAPMQPGQGPGLSLRDLGESGGAATVTLLASEMPAHNHVLLASDAEATTADPQDQLPAQGFWDSGTAAGVIGAYSGNVPADTALNAAALAVTGGGLPHDNMQPYLTLNFCIALQGVFPPRS